MPTAYATIEIGTGEYDVIIEGSYDPGQRERIHPVDYSQEGIASRCEVEKITEDTPDKNPRTWEPSELSRSELRECENLLLQAHNEDDVGAYEDAMEARADRDDMDHAAYGRDIYD